MEETNKKVICYERWDYDMLERIRSLDVRPVEVKNSLTKIELHPNEDGRVMVVYSTKKGDVQGRLYGNLAVQDEEWPTMYWPKGDALQRMARWVRHFLAYKYYRDFDIAGAAPNLLAQVLDRYSLCPPALAHYNKHRSALISAYTRRYKISRDEVKTVFLEILHTGIADTRFALSVTIKQGLDNALRQLTKRPEYIALYKIASKQHNPLGCFSFMVWSREEAKVLMCMREYFAQLGYNSQYVVLLYDGLLVEKDEVLDQTPIDFEALSAHINLQTGYRLQIEEKSLAPTTEDLALLQSFST